MERRVAWVHGIGRHRRGYSDAWREQFDRFLHLPGGSYLEVLWDTVFHPEDLAAARRGSAPAAGEALALTPEEAAAEEAVREEVSAILGARRSALALEGAAAPQAAARGAAPEPLEWAEAVQRVGDTAGAGAPQARGMLSWLVNPDEYLGDFAKYLVSRGVRAAVREEFKRLIRPLAGEAVTISVVSHSWGTVVAYDSLLDLSAEVPALRVANLFTLGSPLWLVRRLLEDRSGRKPPNVANFVNVTARGDVVGSWLRPAFKVDKDYQVPSAVSDTHGSYFVEGNEAVQSNIVAADVLAGGA